MTVNDIFTRRGDLTICTHDTVCFQMQIDPDVEPLDKSGEFRANIAQLENKFNALVNSTADDLNTRKIDLVTVKRALFKPLLFDTNTDTQPPLDDNFTEITDVKSTESLFMLCSYKKIWNVLNPGLLQRVVNQCGSNAVQEEMKQFMDELCQLRKGTRLKEFSEVVGMPSVSDDDSIVNYRMSKEWEERTLEDAEILKRQHAWKEILQLVGAVKNSMILVWRIPRSHKEIFRQTPHSFFEEYEIKRVTLDGVTLFDSEVYMCFSIVYTKLSCALAIGPLKLIKTSSHSQTCRGYQKVVRRDLPPPLKGIQHGYAHIICISV